MKTIDVSLFDGNPFCIKTKSKLNPEGLDYIVDRIPAILEIKLMQEQEDITSKAAKWKTIEQQNFEKWKALLIEVIKTNNEIVNEKDITSLSPIHIIGILMALINYLNEKSQIVYEGLAPEVKAEVEKIQNDIKKKTIEKAL